MSEKSIMENSIIKPLQSIILNFMLLNAFFGTTGFYKKSIWHFTFMKPVKITNSRDDYLRYLMGITSLESDHYHLLLGLYRKTIATPTSILFGVVSGSLLRHILGSMALYQH